MRARAAAWAGLFRPGNAFIAGAGVWLGYASLPAPRPAWSLPLWGCLAMALLTAAGNADNDVADLEVDRVNRPGRPLPAGLIAPAAARLAALVLAAAALLAAAAAGPAQALLTAGMVLLLALYNRRLKGLPLLGNLAVSLLCGLAVALPEFPGPIMATAPAAGFAFLATFAREAAKDLEDMPGDRAAGLRTLPLVAGSGPARKLAAVLVVLLLALLPLPLIHPGYGWPYVLPAALLAGPGLLACLWVLARADADYGKARSLLKWVMLAGMAALLAGALAR